MAKYSKVRHINPAGAANITKINSSKRPDGYVYIIQYGKANVFKIGVSSNPTRRINDIDSHSPVPILEVERFFFKNVYNIEEMIHDNLKGRLIRREWFKIDRVSISSICDQLRQMSEDGLFLIRR